MKFVIISPCYNESESLNEFVNKISDLKKTHNYDASLILIDDGSEDDTWQKIKKLKSENKEINIDGIKLSRNFGKDIAISAGIDYLKKDDYSFIVFLDADLQHPIEEIPNLIQHWKEGYKVVGSKRSNITENPLRELGSRLFYFFLKKYSDLQLITKSMDFMIVDKIVINQFKLLGEKSKSFRASIFWLGFKTKMVEIKINKRLFGESKFGLFKLFRYGITIFTSFSLMPIKLTGYMGVLITIMSMLLILALIILKFILHMHISFQTIIIVFNTFIFGVLLSCIGFVGIYITKIYENTNNRPAYLIEDETKDKLSK